ncbi:sensor histidine kinase [Aquimarina sp. 2201CG5-10]|uniref:sensor histidine kinase n=1 Tax=Aquimarina callyspongiae TaxID=3098150 RepID=UPI002AB47BA4|nr:histidine kinase [Aquimarina sp. 2201CG5-10]MDY8136753.1 histidine kinase [Aquimarina sp. 2201CG5-10]
MKKYFIIISVGFILGILTYLFLGFAEEENQGELLYSGILGVVIAYFIYLFNEILNRLISWRIFTGFRLFTGVLSNTVIAFLLTSIVLYGITFLEESQDTFLDDYNEILLKLAIFIFFVSLIYNVVYFALHSYYQYAKGQIISLQLERKQTELQLAALKSQLSPHFLFNSINTVSSLLFSNIKKAEAFIRELARSYNYTLNNYDNKWVEVKEELQFVNSYYFLLRTRFNDRIVLDVNIPDEILRSKVPPLTLQMLVENAVKHNQMTAEDTLKVTIEYDQQIIKITNNKTIPPKKVDSFKIGLSNIKSRYQLLANKGIEVIDGDDFVVKLPVVL